MGWEDQQKTEAKPTPVADKPADATPEPAAKEAAPPAAPDAEPKPAETPPSAPPPASAEPEPMVPQKLIGKVAKSIREKSRTEISERDQRIRQLEDENQRLKSGGIPDEPEEDTSRIAQVVEVELLKRQDAYGRQKYGKAAYEDACLLVKSQNDPALVAKITRAANPADTLMKEAERIAEELELGDDPVERERKKEEAKKAKWRQEWEAELASKIAARTNQPTNVQNVRAAGGDARPAPRVDTWENTLPR